MKLNISVLSVALITVFLMVGMFDSGEARCTFDCPPGNSNPVCGGRRRSDGRRERKTFRSRCKLLEVNNCQGGGWRVVSQGACPPAQPARTAQ
uniref:Salivary secreted kazaltype proteinase inhibitor n=1 Tax=Triatoma matogrossensis TaxID=162370 RepID=E2J791_9HEMI